MSDAEKDQPRNLALPTGGNDGADTDDGHQEQTELNTGWSDGDQSETSGPSSTEQFPEIDGYQLLRKLGQGGMGSVYLAQDLALGREVAIKTVGQNFSKRQKLLDRFASEVKAVAALNHPNIAQLYGAEILSATPYYVMEYVDGETLERSSMRNPPTPQEAAAVVKKIAQSMAFCHEKKIIHRDLKPSNILLTSDNEPKIADFGLAKSLRDDDGSTKTGEILGTPGYMAPEQASGVDKSIDHRCDVYSIGGILYRLLTGRPPFLSPDPMQTVLMVLSDDPVPPRNLDSGIPNDLNTICLKCLEKNPGSRYDTANGLAQDLDLFLNGKPIKARPVSLAIRVAKWAKRKPAFAAMCASSALAIPAIIGGLWYHTSQLNKALQTADVELQRSRRLAEEGSKFSNWIIYNHLGGLREIGGTTPVQAELVEQIQGYLDAARADMPNEAKFRRRHGQAYVAVGDVLGNLNAANLGKTDQAIENYLTAKNIYEEALLLDPNDVRTQRLQINVLIKQAQASIATEGLAAARKLHEEAELLLSKQSAQGSDDELVSLQLNHQHIIALIEMDEGKQQQLVNRLESMEELLNQFSEDPKWENEKQKNAIWIANSRGLAFTKLGNFEKAAHHLQQAIVLTRQNYQSDPGNPGHIVRYTNAMMTDADLKIQMSKFDEALESYEAVLKIRQASADSNPKDVDALLGLASVFNSIADVFLMQNKPEESIEFANKGLDIRKRLAKANPLVQEYQRNVWLDLKTLASAHNINGDIENAEKLMLQMHDLIEAAVQSGGKPEMDMATLAQCKSDLGLNMLQQFASKATSTDISSLASCRDLEEYKTSLLYFEDALATYKKLEGFAQLTRNDQNYVAQIRKMIELLKSTADQIDQTKVADEES